MAAAVGLLATTVVSNPGCGGSTAAVGASPAGAPPGDGAVQLTVSRPDAAPIQLARLRGQRTLLFLFATFDGMSQASLRPLSRFVRDHPEVQVIGIAVQPNAEHLVDAWIHALEPPFPVGFDADGGIALGTSGLGELEKIPTVMLLDERGRVAARHTGFVSQRSLERMLLRGSRSAPEGAGTNP
jgi:peroxiredoxin